MNAIAIKMLLVLASMMQSGHSWWKPAVADNRPVIWMYSPPYGGCPHCEIAARDWDHRKFKLIRLWQWPAWRIPRDGGFPVFHWACGKEIGVDYGWKNREHLAARYAAVLKKSQE